MNQAKQKIRFVVLAAVLCVLSVGCAKENVSDSITPHSVVYVVEGQQYYGNPQTEEDWSTFWDRMFALAEEGYTVQFWRSDIQNFGTKEKVTFTTTSHAEAEEWCKQKKNEGYMVTLTYDQATGIYTCIAVR